MGYTIPQHFRLAKSDSGEYILIDSYGYETYAEPMDVKFINPMSYDELMGTN